MRRFEGSKVQGFVSWHRRAATRAASCGMVVLLLLCAHAGWAQEVGTVAGVEGSAEIRRAGSTIAAAIGAPVQRGDELRTGRPGKLRVVFQDDSVLTLSDNSQVTIDEQVFNVPEGKIESLMRLLRGKVSAVVSEYYQRPHAQYEIETTTAVAGVRGTEFAVAYDPLKDVTQVVGIEGRVEVHSVLDRLRRGSFVTSGEWTTVVRGEYPTPPKRLNERTFRQYIEGLEFIGRGRPESLTAEHPLVSGADVPQPERAPAASAAAPSDPTRQALDKNSAAITGQPIPVLEALGRLRVRLF
jgi:hypothetical protein